MGGPFDDVFESMAGLIAVITLPIGLLTAIFFGGLSAAVVFVVGWFLLVPLFGILSEWTESSGDGDFEHDDRTDTDSIALLKDRYARGEIDESEFEERVEKLLATDLIPPEAASVLAPSSDEDNPSPTRKDDSGERIRDKG